MGATTNRAGNGRAAELKLVAGDDGPGDRAATTSRARRVGRAGRTAPRAVEADADVTGAACPACEAAHPVALTFCPYCGSPVAFAAALLAEPVPAPAGPPPLAPPPLTARFAPAPGIVPVAPPPLRPVGQPHPAAPPVPPPTRDTPRARGPAGSRRALVALLVLGGGAIGWSLANRPPPTRTMTVGSSWTALEMPPGKSLPVRVVGTAPFRLRSGTELRLVPGGTPVRLREPERRYEVRAVDGTATLTVTALPDGR